MSQLSHDAMLALAREAVLREAEVVRGIADQLDASLVRVVEALVACEGHVLVAGMGTSHAMAHRLAHLLSCCGVPALCIDAADGLHGGSGAIKAGDVLYVISRGGESAELNRFVQIARQRGALVIAQTEAPESSLASLADLLYVVRTPVEADLLGAIATGTSLVAAAAGDALCAVLVRLRGQTLEAFAATHPSGAVGKRLTSAEG